MSQAQGKGPSVLFSRQQSGSHRGFWQSAHGDSFKAFKEQAGGSSLLGSSPTISISVSWSDTHSFCSFGHHRYTRLAGPLNLCFIFVLLHFCLHIHLFLLWTLWRVGFLRRWCESQESGFLQDCEGVNVQWVKLLQEINFIPCRH